MGWVSRSRVRGLRTAALEAHVYRSPGVLIGYFSFGPVGVDFPRQKKHASLCHKE
ncbi:hypothetical protein EG328_007167 [Venturia inaequalis]|uniref:Uncharacterized protein n=1 Tax=Venturia inaequalis TaxID=5025 RepID=A0A8H3UF94_VENIN|nr:hypothetical protein EG328_007167 [Venturia inaequalis]